MFLACLIWQIFCFQHGIHQEFTCEHTPEQNGKMELFWETIDTIARCLLETAGLPESFWSFAYRAAFHIKNRCLHFAHGTTPLLTTQFFDNSPDVSHFRVFGYQTFMYLEKPKRKKSKVELWKVFYSAIATILSHI